MGISINIKEMKMDRNSHLNKEFMHLISTMSVQVITYSGSNLISFLKSLPSGHFYIVNGSPYYIKNKLKSPGKYYLTIRYPGVSDDVSTYVKSFNREEKLKLLLEK